MAIVAVAGGTGVLGRTLLDTIAKAGEHKAIVLSRTAAAFTTTNEPRIFAVDYNKVEQMKHVFQENNVEVVVSAMLLVDEGVAQS